MPTRKKVVMKGNADAWFIHIGIYTPTNIFG
jgi:hypothetical protein